MEDEMNKRIDPGTYLLCQDIQHILNNQGRIMTAIDEMTAEIAKLRTLVEADNTNDAAAVSALKDRITVLEGVIANSGTPEQIQAAIDEIKSIETLITPAG